MWYRNALSPLFVAKDDSGLRSHQLFLSVPQTFRLSPNA